MFAKVKQLYEERKWLERGGVKMMIWLLFMPE
jgi:hypothetical protein